MFFNIKNNFIRKIFLILFIIFFNGSVFADDLYEINLIVFKHVTKEGLKSEYFRDSFRTPNLKNTIELLDKGFLYVSLPDDERGLIKEASILNKTHGYQILVHKSWIQPVTKSKYAKWIHIFGGQDKELEGKIRISKTRFFDINANFYLSLPSSVTGNNSNRLQTFKLIETRRTAMNKINYLDHPIFGALIEIVPYNYTKAKN